MSQAEDLWRSIDMDIVRFCDLDGTIIFSYRYEIGDKVCVECLNEKELSFMRCSDYARLQAINRFEFVPVTSRTKKQYERLKLFEKDRILRYALIDNGGRLLIDGVDDEQWYKETCVCCGRDIQVMLDIVPELEKYGKVKVQDDLVVFLKQTESVTGEYVHEIVRKTGCLQIFKHGEKTYICSNKLTKGNAVARFRNKFGVPYAIAAGDAQVDLSMAAAVEKSYFSDKIYTQDMNLGEINVEFVNQFDLVRYILEHKRMG